MAYNQHPLNGPQSHYNKPALVIIALIFIGIIAFVVIRQLFPGLITDVGVNTEQQITPIISDANKTPVIPNKPQNKPSQSNENKTQSQPLKEKTSIAPKTNQTAAGVSCTQKDISAGLCQ
jgi:hypothetical protein